VVIAGDGFYYLPTHELNSGAALIGYRMDQGGTADQETQFLPEPLRNDEWAKVQELPWDWDTLEARRLDHVLQGLPGKIPGTRQQPLTNEAAQAVAAIPDAALNSIIWEAQDLRPPKRRVYTAGLKHDLEGAVAELISTEWRPLLFPAGKFPEESYRFFTEPTETLYTLALAYPHLSATLQAGLKTYVTKLGASGGPFEGPVGQRIYRTSEGSTRSAYDPPPEKLCKFQSDILRNDVARLYPCWAWAQTSQDWSKLERDWPALRGFAERRPNPMEEDCRNGYLAGLIAYCRIADHMKDQEAVASGVAVARSAIRDRLVFEFAHTRGGLIWQVPKLRSIFSRWRFLTPEVGRLLNQQVRTIHAGLMDRYVEYHRPTWWLAWDVETMMRNESPYEFPSMSVEVFAARSLILNEGPDKLGLFIDRPWCHADLYYIQKLALTLNAANEMQWTDVRGQRP
jgi:hypothetical protein